MKNAGTMLIAVAFLAASAAVGTEPTATQPVGRIAASRPSEEIETFVLTPIQVESFSLLVPAEVTGPTTNNSCHSWGSHIESCYLPSRRLDCDEKPAMPSLVSLLREHLSAVVGAWRPGAWPVDGASIDVPVEQYTSIEHLWLTYYTDLSEHIGSCWLDERSDPGTQLDRAMAGPAAHVEIEVFSGTRDAKGYPFKVRF